MPQNQKLNHSKFKLRTKHKIWVILILAFLSVQFLNFTGFCYGELSYLSKREILDRHLFSPDYSKLSEHEKVQKLKERGAEYPGCCTIKGEPLDSVHQIE